MSPVYEAGTTEWCDECANVRTVCGHPYRGANAERDPKSIHRGQARFAYELAEKYAGHLLHVHGLGWHRYDAARWVEDDQGEATRAVLAILRDAHLRAFDSKDRDLGSDVRKCESAAGIAGILQIAAALETFAATVADLDADPYLLNVANGTLDLRTMTLVPHDPAHRITKVARAAYDPRTKGPTWEAFLERVLPDADVREFLQRYVGTALSGRVLEHVLAILIGTGRNGKGVTYTALNHALGDYAATAEPDLFMHREGAHPTGEMDLRGVRWVVVSESDQGRRLAEATVKRLTGGDRIRARRMRQDFVEFEPSHTAALITNHLPKVGGDDPAIWARLRVVPFTVVIPKAEQDPHLGEKLQLEADAILTWAIHGWADYQRQGLAEPEAVVNATDAYRDDMDLMGQFIKDDCITGRAYWCKFADLFAAWQEFARDNAAAPTGKRDFGASLDRLGFEAEKGSANIAGRRGIALRAAEDR